MKAKNLYLFILFALLLVPVVSADHAHLARAWEHPDAVTTANPDGTFTQVLTVNQGEDAPLEVTGHSFHPPSEIKIEVFEGESASGTPLPIPDFYNRENYPFNTFAHLFTIHTDDKSGVYTVRITLETGVGTDEHEVITKINTLIVNSPPTLDPLENVEMFELDADDPSVDSEVIQLSGDDADGTDVSFIVERCDGNVLDTIFGAFCFGPGGWSFDLASVSTSVVGDTIEIRPDFTFITHPESTRIFSLRVTAVSDGDESEPQVIQVIVHDVNQGTDFIPLVDPIADQTIERGQTLNFDTTARDDDAEDELEFSITNSNPLLPSAADFPFGSVQKNGITSTATFNWPTTVNDLATDASGNLIDTEYTVTLRVEDNILTGPAEGVDEETITITVLIKDSDGDGLDDADDNCPLGDGDADLTEAVDKNPDQTDTNGNGEGDICDPVILGCTDDTAINYDPNANTDDGSCIPEILGCTDPSAFNYNPNANTDDGSCVPIVNGCTDPAATNYNPNANTDDGSCTYFVPQCSDGVDNNDVEDSLADAADPGCHTDGDATNPASYDPTDNDESNTVGCTDPAAFNYDPNAIADDGSCVPVVTGCTDPAATNYNPNANTDDGSCTYFVPQCSDGVDNNDVEDSLADAADPGCHTDGDPTNPASYDPTDNDEGNTVGCTDPAAFNYDPNAIADDGSCVPVVTGCTDPAATNYNPNANTDDGSCIAEVLGCTDPAAFNYNPNANTDDGSCIPVVNGCTDPAATNYNPSANTNDGSCTYPVPECRDGVDNADLEDDLIDAADPGCWTDPSDPSTYDPNDPSETLVIVGCMDPAATNYNEYANTAGVCIYPVPECRDGVDNADLEDDLIDAADPGCWADPTDPNTYDPDDPSEELIILGCTDPTADNYNQYANTDDGSCILNRPPVIDPIPLQIVRVGDTVTVTITASDPDGDDLTYILPIGNNFPDAFTLVDNGDGTADFTMTVTQEGVFAGIVVVSDGQLTDDEILRVLVLPCLDSDGDGVCDNVDICPIGDDSIDTDGDGHPDACDQCQDVDGDGYCDVTDNCPITFNPDQKDLDRDGEGDACDDDDDDDGIADDLDNCPRDYNPTQRNICSQHNGLTIMSVHMVPEMAPAGSSFAMPITVENRGGLEVENARITVFIYDLGIRLSSSTFDLKSYDDATFIFDIPAYYATPGIYDVEVRVGNDHIHDKTYRAVTLV